MHFVPRLQLLCSAVAGVSLCCSVYDTIIFLEKLFLCNKQTNFHPSIYRFIYQYLYHIPKSVIGANQHLRRNRKRIDAPVCLLAPQYTFRHSVCSMHTITNVGCVLCLLIKVWVHFWTGECHPSTPPCTPSYTTSSACSIVSHILVYQKTNLI